MPGRNFAVPRRRRKDHLAKTRLLRVESLEPRAMLSAAAAVARAAITAPGGLVVSGATEPLVAQGFDQSGNSLPASLRYTWSATTLPNGAKAPSFTANNSTAAQTTTARFSQAGVYGLMVKVTDTGGHSATSTVAVTVSQTFTDVKIAPVTAAVKGTTQQLSAQALDQFSKPIVSAASLTCTWSVGTTPSGAPAPTFSNGANPSTTATFGQTGAYSFTATMSDGNGHSAGAAASVTVSATATSVTITPAAGGVAGGTTEALSAQGFDQFGRTLPSTAKYAWSATTLPSGAKAPTFSANGTNAAQNTTATFAKTGTFGLSVKVTDANAHSATATVSVTVAQTLTSAVLDVSQAQVTAGATRQFTVRAFDQFQKAMATPPAFSWTTTIGSISGGGLFTASGPTGSGTVTATSGSIAATASVTIAGGNPGYPGIQDPTLAGLVSTLDADGSINRQDMIQIFQTVAQADGTVSTADVSDLKTILSSASALHIPGYVQVLAGDVINGNTANAGYQGQTLGNLSAGCPASRLTKLVNKWFLGADHPATSYSYHATSGTLFASSTPVYTDVRQGYLGDCYFVAAMGTIAKGNPTAVKNMFVDNGDGTWTVRFYSGTATADYVTVDNQLPTDGSGNLVYSDCGQSASSGGNVLWIPLAEKAYAQWNETGLEGRDGTNTYAGIEGGWMADVDGQVLGRAAPSYGMTASAKQIMIAALGANKAVSAGTNSNPGNKLYGGHAYLVTGYNASSDTFTLYNPWGFAHPGPLSWSQLQTSCMAFVVADASGSAAVSSVRGNAMPTVPAAAHDAVFASGQANRDLWSNDAVLRLRLMMVTA